MTPPNTTWRDILAQAAQSREVLRQPDMMRNVQNILQTNERVCSSLGHHFIPQMERIYMDMLQVYRCASPHRPRAAGCWALVLGSPHCCQGTPCKRSCGAADAACPAWIRGGRGARATERSVAQAVQQRDQRDGQDGGPACGQDVGRQGHALGQEGRAAPGGDLCGPLRGHRPGGRAVRAGHYGPHPGRLRQQRAGRQVQTSVLDQLPGANAGLPNPCWRSRSEPLKRMAASGPVPRSPL